MPPKKREKDGEASKNQRMESLKTDHDLFLTAFEKPTQIYRFLRVRNTISPIFLYRNLSYMRSRMSRSNKSRQGFKVDSILEKVQARSLLPELFIDGFMTLTFLGFYDKKEALKENEPSKYEPVKVETLLLKICNKKRKEASPMMTIGSCYIPINPSEECPPPKAPTVSIPTNEFCQDDNEIKSYHLVLRVYNMKQDAGPSNADSDTSEPAQKRRKSSVNPDDMKLYGTDLIIYDKQKRCLLGDGDYELLLEEMPRSLPKNRSWEQFSNITEDCNSFELFRNGPTLKFKLEWSREQRSPFVERPRAMPANEEELLDSNCNKENRPERMGKKQPTEKKEDKKSGSSSSSLEIVYQFHYNSSSRQQTEPCKDLHCPWCSVNCLSVYSLLKHLKLCHARFTFTYTPLPNLGRIDVAINEQYDGSYTGSPHDVIAQPGGSAFSRDGPQIRTTVSNILVCHPKRVKPSLTEFMELEEDSGDVQRSFITGHNRLYHHTVTCLPVHPKEMDNDSEGENDPKWLQTKTVMMIDDFTDVNEGEKELMKMWNLHVMKEGYVGDCQIPIACKMFLEKKGQELLSKNLYRNFVVHMCGLFDYGLVSPVALYQIMMQLQEMVGESSAKILQSSWKAQKEHWVSSGAKDRLQTPAHLKSQAGSGSDAGSRRKLYSSYKSESLKTQQEDEEDEDDDEEGEQGKSSSSSSASSTSSESSTSRRQANNCLGNDNGKKPVVACAGAGAGTAAGASAGFASKSQTLQQKPSIPQSIATKTLLSVGQGLTNAEITKKRMVPAKTVLPPVTNNKLIQAIHAAHSANSVCEPPAKKKLVVPQSNGKLEIVNTQTGPSSGELKRKLSLGPPGPIPKPAEIKKTGQKPAPLTNGLPTENANKATHQQLPADSKKKVSLPVSSNVINCTTTMAAEDELKKKVVPNGNAVSPIEQKKKLPQTLALSPGTSSSNCVDNSDASNAVRKSSLDKGSSPNGSGPGAPTLLDNGPQRRKSLCLDSTSQPQVAVCLRRKSFSNNQSIDATPIATQKSITS